MSGVGVDRLMMVMIDKGLRSVCFIRESVVYWYPYIRMIAALRTLRRYWVIHLTSSS